MIVLITHKLPVGIVLRFIFILSSPTLEYEKKGSFGDLGVLQTSRFLGSWQMETFLPESPDSTSSDQISSLACDGKFLYLISGDNKGLMKIGTGKNGTMR